MERVLCKSLAESRLILGLNSVYYPMDFLTNCKYWTEYWVNIETQFEIIIQILPSVLRMSGNSMAGLEGDIPVDVR